MRVPSTDPRLGAEQLPLLPRVVAELNELDRSRPAHRSGFDEIVALMSVDPPLALRVLEAANSASSAPVSPVETLEGAAARVGARRITDLVGMIAAEPARVPLTPGQERLWTHAVEVATACRSIAEAQHLGAAFSQHMYLSGLLHDIGRFVMFERRPDGLDEVDRATWSSANELIAVEHRVWGADHTELGARLLREHGVGDHVADLARDHHTYGRTDDLVAHLHGDDEAVLRLHIVQTADLLSRLRLDDVVELHRDSGNESQLTVTVERDHLIERVQARFTEVPLMERLVAHDQLVPIVSAMLRASHAASDRLGLHELGAAERAVN